MKINVSILCLLAFIQAQASSELVKIRKQSQFAPHTLGNVDLFHHNGQFIVKQDNTFHHVAPHNIVDPELRNIKLESLSALLQHGKIHIKQNDHKEFMLRAHIDGNGGGKVWGQVFKGVTYVAGAGTIGFLAYIHAVHAEQVPEMMSTLSTIATVAEAVGEGIPGPL